MTSGWVFVLLAVLAGIGPPSDRAGGEIASPPVAGVASSARVGFAFAPAWRLGAAIERLWPKRPEWGDMAVAILKGEAFDESKGWWRPSACLYGFEWLRDACDTNGDGRIELTEARGLGEHFHRLDRDEDGAIQRDDLEGPAPQEPAAAVEALFRRLDADGNERVSWDEVTWFFQQADRRKRGYVTRRDLAALFPDLAAADSGDPEDGEADRGDRGAGRLSKWRLLRLFVTGQLGSFAEGPALGAAAPQFMLEPLRGGEPVRLPSIPGPRPVVLIFGSFT